MNTAILALIGTISAVQLNREPLLANNASPLEIHQRPAYSDYPVDYVVPDFGLSHEILYTQNNIKKTEEQMNHKINTSFDQKSNPVNPRDYTATPDMGLDVDIKASLKNLSDEEGNHGFWMVDAKTKVPAGGVTDVAKEIKIAESYPGYFQPIYPKRPSAISAAEQGAAMDDGPVVTVLKSINGKSTAGSISHTHVSRETFTRSDNDGESTKTVNKPAEVVAEETKPVEKEVKEVAKGDKTETLDDAKKEFKKLADDKEVGGKNVEIGGGKKVIDTSFMFRE